MDAEMKCYICGKPLSSMNWMMASVSNRFAPLVSRNLCNDHAFSVSEKLDDLIEEMKERNDTNGK